MPAPGIVQAGTASMRVDGKSISVVGNVAINLGTARRETLEAATGPVGFKTRAGIPSIAFESYKDTSIDLEEIMQLNGVDITVTLSDGTTYAFSNAWSVSEGELNAEESKMALVFHAKSAKEVPPQ